MRQKQYKNLKFIRHSDNAYALTFAGSTYDFPFKVRPLIRELWELRERLLDEETVVTDLHNYPGEIFENTDLKDHIEYRALVYNMIEAIINNIIPKNKSNELTFKSFLILCEVYATKNSHGESNGVATALYQDKLTFNIDELSKGKEEKRPFSLTQIALFYIHSDWIISNENKDEIAFKHGYGSKTSGKVLFRNYNKYSTIRKRIKNDGISKNRAKLKAFKSVISMFGDQNIVNKIEKEIEIIESL